jgi:hypothetical protein
MVKGPKLSHRRARMNGGGHVTEDMWDARERWADGEAHRREQQRQALAALPAARGEQAAAAIVAMSDWRTDLVDNWNGGQYRGVLAVPPTCYDVVDGELRDALAGAAGAILGVGFAGLDIEVRLGDAAPGWDVELLTWLRESTAADPAIRALPPGAADGG